MNNVLEFLTDEVKQDIKEAQQEGHFKWIDDVGFFTWFEIRKNGKPCKVFYSTFPLIPLLITLSFEG